MRLTLFLHALLTAIATAAPVDFNRDVRPILSDRCFTCHGPDDQRRMAKLCFDTEAGAKANLGGGRFAIVPGDSAKSLLVQRIAHANKALRMPVVACL